jgi:ribosomal protein S18 acetylase RimI-like enzyme
MIRRARLHDLDAVGRFERAMDELHARLLPGYFRRPARPASAEHFHRVLGDGDQAIFVAEKDRVLLGMAHVQLYDTPPKPTLTPRRRVHLESLYVVETARRQGLGRLLIEASGAWGVSKSAEEFVLTVWAGNEAAERFYAALGFGKVSTVLGMEL